MFDPQVHARNRSLFSKTELAKHYGRHVAWSFDGTQILASGATGEELYSEIKRLGLTEYVSSYVDEFSRTGGCRFLEDEFDDSHDEMVVIDATSPPEDLSRSERRH
jgi:hypothetical protein